MACDSHKVDTNITSLSFAEEECLKELPGSGGANAIWYGLEPNSYSDFGGDLTTVARSPINPSRQNKKGVITDLEAKCGFTTDFTQNNMNRLLQGFFFADARELATTKPLSGGAVAFTGVTSSDNTYAAAAGLDIFKVGQLVQFSGFANAGNNGIKKVASSTATTLVVVEATVDETPAASAYAKTVGFQFGSADIDLAVTNGIPALISSAADFTTLGLIPGAWVFIGGDGAANAFANNVGYARVKSVTANALSFDDTTFAPVNETGTGITLKLFVGTIIKNESDPSLIKRRSYNFERTLGKGPTATQAEYIEGAVPNEMTLDIPKAEKLTMTLGFVAADNTYRSGETGDEIKPGVRVPALGEDAYNTSHNVYRNKLAVIDPASSNPSALFGYVSDAKISLKNGITANKAVGILGAFDLSAGNFEVSGTMNAYFTTIDAIKAVRNNADVGFSSIMAADNAGFVFDIPLVGLGGSKLNLEKDQPIMVPLDSNGAENENGYTMLYESFSYLPDIAMG